MSKDGDGYRVKHGMTKKRRNDGEIINYNDDEIEILKGENR